MSAACCVRVRALRLALSCAGLVALSGCSAQDSATAPPPSARCSGCHLREFQATTRPPHPGVRPDTCAVCHDEAAWHPARKLLVHSFPLDGAHAKTACFDCHRGPRPTFEGTTRQCADCHQKEHESANAKVEHHASFPSQCQTCHTTMAWKPTLPHDEPALATETEPLSAAPAQSFASSAAKPALKPPKAASSGTAAWSNKQPSPKPDQVSGASRIKGR